MKFGKKPARRTLKTLALSNYMKASAVAFPPAMAWERPIDYGMLANDSVGDCTIAGMYHQRMNWAAVASAGSPLIVTDQEALSDYSAITGYVPGDQSTDNGAELAQVISWYKEKQVLDGSATIDLGNIDQVKAAMYNFGGLYVGIIVPQSMVDQLNSGQDPTWAFVANDKASGEGHCIYLCGYGRSGFALVSWGKIYRASWDFFSAWVDEADALVSKAWIKASGVSPSGLDLNGLLQDAAAV
jgi:hypothetical protein